MDLVRDAPAGQLIRLLTGNKILQYPEEKPDFTLPDVWLQLMNNSEILVGERTGDQEDTSAGTPARPIHNDNDKSKHFVPDIDAGETSGRRVKEKDTEDDDQSDSARSTNASAEIADNVQHLQEYSRQKSPNADGIMSAELQMEADEMADLQKTASVPVVPKKTKTGVILVDWYDDDQEDPHRWSITKRGVVTGIIFIYTVVVYMSSAIYTSSEGGIEKAFGVNSIDASLGLSMYVLGYGVGPLILSPLSEIAVIGRSPVYVVTMALFVILSIPTAFVRNYAGLMVLRVIQGFLGSPCLGSGPATLGDIYSFLSLPFALSIWVVANFCGPSLGPLLSGFAVPVKGWRWSLFEIIWASAPVLVIMFLFLPETSSPTILLRRARRLRKLTGNNRFMSQSEIDQRHMTVSAVAVDALIKPLEITLKDPAMLFIQLYSAIIYAIYYSCKFTVMDKALFIVLTALIVFEVFPLVYPPYYGFNLGQIGVVFLCILISCLTMILPFWSYIRFYLNPRIMKRGLGPQEERLIPAIPMSFGLPIGLFLFAWAARPSIHWIAPTIGIAIYTGSVFVVMQCLFIYIPLSYQAYAASLFAANDFFRSALACGSIVFAHPLYNNLGVAKGTSLLGGLSVIGIVGVILLYIFGAKLRSMSKFAVYAAPE